MFAAYLYQSVNLLTGVLMVPILLRHLEPGQFLMWAIFTAIGGLTLQVESSIQVVSVRRIANAWHAQQPQQLHEAQESARRVYRMLSTFTLVVVTSGGAAYLLQTASGRLDASWLVEWLLFMVTYAINYWFGANTASLLARAQVATYNYIAASTRALNLAITVMLLVAGWGVLGICVSFAVSMTLNCTLIGMAARRAVSASQAQLPAPAAAPATNQGVGDIIRYTLFMLGAFILYKGGVLIATWHFSKDAVSSYSLMIQAFTMLGMFALVPIQVWLPGLMKAIVGNDREAVMRELARTLLLANGAFVAGSLLLALLGHDLLELIGARIELPPASDLVIAAVAFGIELNLFILVNLLVSKQQFNFVKVYLGCVALAFLGTVTALALHQPLMRSFITVPAAVQGLLCLPLMLKLLCRQLGLPPVAFARSLLRGLQRA